MSTFTPCNVLVTGGAGFIGSHFVRYLLSQDRQIQIVTLDALTYAGSLDNLVSLSDSKRHHFIQGDICDRSLIRSILRDYSIETVVHFAAESHVDRSITGPAVFIQTNIVGTYSLLEESRIFWLDEKSWDNRSCRFHHISTDEVYGSLGPQDPPFSETTAYFPNSPYSASKAASDHLVRAYQHTYGLPTTATNCSNNYGPFQNEEKFIPTIIRSCLEGKPIPIYGDGSNIRTWLYVVDHCSAVNIVIRHGCVGETYNIGGSKQLSNLEAVNLICSILAEITQIPVSKFTGLITFITDRPGHDWRYAVDSSKIQKELNVPAQESFESGMRKTIEWYLNKHSTIRAEMSTI